MQIYTSIKKLVLLSTLTVAIMPVYAGNPPTPPNPDGKFLGDLCIPHIPDICLTFCHSKKLYWNGKLNWNWDPKTGYPPEYCICDPT